jgi:hypothetical protein
VCLQSVKFWKNCDLGALKSPILVLVHYVPLWLTNRFWNFWKRRTWNCKFWTNFHFWIQILATQISMLKVSNIQGRSEGIRRVSNSFGPTVKEGPPKTKFTHFRYFCENLPKAEKLQIFQRDPRYGSANIRNLFMLKTTVDWKKNIKFTIYSF